MNALQIVPARGGSKAIPLKNIAPCGGQPLIWWTLDAAAAANYPVVVSTDSEIIETCVVEWAQRNHRYPAPVILRRPSELAQDYTPLEPVIADVLDRWSGPVDVIVVLQPTSPLRTAKQIVEAVASLCDRNLDSLFSAVPSHAFTWRLGPVPGQLMAPYDVKERPNRQQVVQFEENGAIYAFTYDLWRKERCRLGGRIGMYVMGEDHRCQVDTPADLYLAEKMLTREWVCVSANRN